jgi:hypothetical protein
MKSKPDFEKKERKPGDSPGQRPQGQNPGGGQRGNFNNDRDRNSRPPQGGGMGNPFGGDWFSQAQGKKR